MAKPQISEVTRVREEQRTDGGTDLLVKLAMKDGHETWLALRLNAVEAYVLDPQAEQKTSQARSSIFDKRPKPAPLIKATRSRTLKATIKSVIAAAPNAQKQARIDAEVDLHQLHRDAWYEKDHAYNIRRVWRIHELMLPPNRNRRTPEFIARLSCSKPDYLYFGHTQFVLEARTSLGQVGLRNLSTHYLLGEIDHDLDRIASLESALARDDERQLSYLLADLVQGIENVRDAKLLFDQRREAIGDQLRYQDKERANSVRGTGRDLDTPLSVKSVYNGRLTQAILLESDDAYYVMGIREGSGRAKTASLVGPNNYGREVLFTTPIETARVLLGRGNNPLTAEKAQEELAKIIDRDFSYLLHEHNLGEPLITICEVAVFPNGELAALYSVLPSVPHTLPANCPRPVYRIRHLTQQPWKNATGTRPVITTLPSGTEASTYEENFEQEFATFIKDATSPKRYRQAIKYLYDNRYHDDPGYIRLEEALDAWRSLTAGEHLTGVDGLVCPVGPNALQRLGDLAHEQTIARVKVGIAEGYWNEEHLNQVIARQQKEQQFPPELWERISDFIKAHECHVDNNAQPLAAPRKRGRPPKVWESEEAKLAARRAAKAEWARAARAAGRIKEPAAQVAARQTAWRNRKAAPPATTEPEERE